MVLRYTPNDMIIRIKGKYCLDVNQATKEIERLLNYDFDVLMYTHGKDIMENAKTHVKRLVQKTR